jgi:hypothetical protein
MRYRIASIDQKDDETGLPLYWNDSDGWVSRDSASLYLKEQRERTHYLPLGGRWELMAGSLSENDRFVLHLIIDDQVVATQFCFVNLRTAIRQGWEVLGGIPQAELSIRRHGKMVAFLHTNFRGELEEAQIYANGRRGIIVIDINPQGPIFQGVFV